MRYSPRNIRVACDHKGLTHVGGIHFFHEFLRVLQLRHFLATHLTYPRRNNHYHLSRNRSRGGPAAVPENESSDHSQGSLSREGTGFRAR